MLAVPSFATLFPRVLLKMVVAIITIFIALPAAAAPVIVPGGDVAYIDLDATAPGEFGHYLHVFGEAGDSPGTSGSKTVVFTVENHDNLGIQFHALFTDFNLANTGTAAVYVFDLFGRVLGAETMPVVPGVLSEMVTGTFYEEYLTFVGYADGLEPAPIGSALPPAEALFITSTYPGLTSSVPVPAALPLMLGGLCLLGGGVAWRKKRA